MAHKYWGAQVGLGLLPHAGGRADGIPRGGPQIARCGDEKAVEAFVEASVTDLMRPVVTLHDSVSDGLAELPADARPDVERVLFGQFNGQTSPIRLVRHRSSTSARLDGLNDRQIAGAVTGRLGEPRAPSEGPGLMGELSPSSCARPVRPSF